MSRVPRALEYLKTGFTTEAVAAARYRAYAERARREGKPNLSARWLELAEAKDELAVRLLEAAGQVRSDERAVADALGEERFENDVLYPKMMRQVDEETARVLSGITETQAQHLERLVRLRRELQAATGDLG